MAENENNEKKQSFSHKMYDQMGLNMSLKAINIFIAVISILLVIAIIVGTRM